MVNYSTFTDQQLVDNLTEGSRAAFSEIYERYKFVLLNHAYNKIRNREEARDVVQDVFSMLWHKRDTLVITNLSAFLFTAVRNLILDKFLHKAVQEKYLSSLLQFVNEENNFTDHKIRENQLKEQIEKEIAALTPKMRIVFELSRNEHLTHKEIADRLGISEQTVSKHVTNAIKILKEKLHLFVLFYYMM